MFPISANPVFQGVVVITLFFAVLSENCVKVGASPAPVIKKDAAIFDPKPVQFDHFDLAHYSQNSPSQSQIHPSIDPIVHEESSPKSVRSINTGVKGSVANAIATNNADTPAGTALLQALTAIQSAAENSGVHLNSDPGIEQTSVADVQTQIKKLKEQVELYQMINDMLKAETMVQKEPEVSSTPPPTTVSSLGHQGHDALPKPVEVEVTTPQPKTTGQIQLPKRTRQRSNAPQKPVVVPIVPPTLAPPQIHQDDHHGENHNAHEEDRQVHRDYGNNHYRNHPGYEDNDHDHEEHNHSQNGHVDTDYDQYHNNHRQHRHQIHHQQQPQYNDYDQGNYHNPSPMQRPQVTQQPRERQIQNRGQMKFKRNN